MAAGDAITVLKADHATVKKLFAKFDDMGERAVKGKHEVVRDICRELAVHMEIEEEVFYPRLRRAGKETKDEVLEGIEEHGSVKQLVDDLGRMSPEDEMFDAKVKVLKEQVEHHVEEEEGEMFPSARAALGDAELVRLGAELTRAKEVRAALAP